MAKFYRNGGNANGGKSQEQAAEKKHPEVTFGPYSTGSSMIECAVWGNLVGDKGEERLMHSVTIRRSYFDDKAKEWKESGSYRPCDIPYIVLGLNSAFEWIANERQKK